MPDARVVIDPGRPIAELDDRVFGGFVEHMGRAIYGGIYEPGHPTADAAGWRTDVADLVRSLGVTTIRYPGGNFVSGYAWEDGVGPRETRPTRADAAWHAMEPNLVGTDDFVQWCHLVGAEPMLAVNLGTRGAAEAAALVEYVNGGPGTTGGDRRRANGFGEPHRVRTWCLGNEMDGAWQIGAKPAAEYGALAAEAARAMRRIDPSIELVACGSSGPTMPTFGVWESTVLERVWDVVDALSLHLYVDPAAHPDPASYLRAPAELDRAIIAVAERIDREAARRGSPRRIAISVDEWNVWRLSEHLDREAGALDGPPRTAPPLAEDQADVLDALVVGGLLLSLLRHADRVRMACIAQLVNVIPLIRTIDGGPAWLNATASPFRDVARSARGGTVLEVGFEWAPPRDQGEDALDAASVIDGAGDLWLYVVNRSPEAVDMDVAVAGAVGVEVIARTELADPDLRAASTATAPDRVGSRPIDATSLPLRLHPFSWNVLRLRVPR